MTHNTTTMYQGHGDRAFSSVLITTSIQNQLNNSLKITRLLSEKIRLILYQSLMSRHSDSELIKATGKLYVKTYCHWQR